VIYKAIQVVARIGKDEWMAATALRNYRLRFWGEWAAESDAIGVIGRRPANDMAPSAPRSLHVLSGKQT
jgi:hypothetical protein